MLHHQSSKKGVHNSVFAAFKKHKIQLSIVIPKVEVAMRGPCIHGKLMIARITV